LRDALDHIRCARHVELAASEIIEEEQWFRALYQDVIDAHRDQIDTDGVVLVEHESQFELGTDAIGAGYQNRLLVLLADFEHRAETAKAAHDAFTHGALGKRLDRFDQRIASIDVYTGITIGKRSIGSGAHDLNKGQLNDSGHRLGSLRSDAA